MVEGDVRTSECDASADCAARAETLFVGRERLRDSERALRFGRRACALGASDSCVLWAERLSIGDGVARSESDAVSLLEIGCRAEHVRACAVLSWHLARGVGAPRDILRASQLSSAACASGDAFACAEARTHLAMNDRAFVWRERAARAQDDRRRGVAERRSSIGVCELGQAPTGESGLCCWPGQAEQGGACAGRPAWCPPGSSAAASRCEQDPSDASLVERWLPHPLGWGLRSLGGRGWASFAVLPGGNGATWTSAGGAFTLDVSWFELQVGLGWAWGTRGVAPAPTAPRSWSGLLAGLDVGVNLGSWPSPINAWFSPINVSVGVSAQGIIGAALGRVALYVANDVYFGCAFALRADYAGTLVGQEQLPSTLTASIMLAPRWPRVCR